MRLLNAAQLYVARALVDSIDRQRAAARAARESGDIDAGRRATVKVVLLRRRLDRLGSRV